MSCKAGYFVCKRCVQKPAYRSQDKFDLHRESCHEMPSDDIPQNSSPPRKITPRRKLSDLMASRASLEEQLKATKQHMLQLENVSGEQEETIKLVKRQIRYLEKIFETKNEEIERLKRIKKSIIRVEEQPQKVRNDTKKPMDVEYLALMDSMKVITGLDFADSNSDVKQEIRECCVYKDEKLNSLENRIQAFTNEVQQLKESSRTLKTQLLREVSVKEDVKKMLKDAQTKYFEKKAEVEESKKQITVLQEQILQHKRVIERLTSELRAFQQKYNEFKDKSIQSQSLVEQLHQDIAKCLEDQTHQKIENEELRSGMLNLKESAEDKEESVRMMKQTEKALKLKIQRLTMDLEDVQIKEQNEDFRVKQIQLKFEERVDMLEMEKEMLNASNEKLKENLRIAGVEEDVTKKNTRELEREKAYISRERNNLKRELDKTKRHFEETGKQLQEMKQTSKDSNDQKKKLLSEKFKLQRELRSTKTDLAKLKKNQSDVEKDGRENVVAEIEIRKSNLEEIRKDLNKATKYQHRQEEQLCAQIERLQREIQDRDEVMKKMEKESKDVQNTLFQTIHELREKCQLADEKLSEDAFKEMEAFKTSLDEAKKVITEQSNKFDKLKVLHLKLDTELIKVSSFNLGLEKERDSFKKKLDKVSIEKSDMSKELSKLKLILQESKSPVIKDLQQKLSLKSEEAERTRNEKQRCKEKIQNVLEEKEIDLESYRKELCKAEETYEEDIRKMQMDLDEKNQNLESLREELLKAENTHDENIRKMRKSLDEKENNFKLSEERLSMEHTKNIQVEEQLKESEKQIEQLQSQIKLSQNKSCHGKDTLESQLRDNKDECEKLRRELEASQARESHMEKENQCNLEKIEESKDLLAKEKEKLAKKLIHSEALQISLSTRVDEMSEQLSVMEKLKKDLVIIQEEKVKLEIKLNETVDKQQKNGGSVSSPREINRLREKLMECQSEKDKVKKDLQDNLQQMKKKEKEDSNEIKDVRKELNMCTSKLEKSLEEIRVLKMKLEETGNVDSLKEQLEDCEHDKHQMKIELEECLATQRALQIRVDELVDDAEYENEKSEGEGNSDGQIEKLNNQLEKTSQEKEKLTNQLTQTSQEKEKMANQLAQTSQDKKLLDGQLLELQQKLSEASKEFSAKRRAMDELRDNTDSQIKKLNEQLQTKERENDRLSERTSLLVKRENQLAKDQRNTEDELYQTKNKMDDLQKKLQNSGSIKGLFSSVELTTSFIILILIRSKRVVMFSLYSLLIDSSIGRELIYQRWTK